VVPLPYTRTVLWEAVFFLVLLKIPLVYACLVVWWAIRAEPRDEHPVAAGAVTDTPSAPVSWTRASRRRGPTGGGRRGPREGAAKRYVPAAGARR